MNPKGQTDSLPFCVCSAGTLCTNLFRLYYDVHAARHVVGTIRFALRAEVAPLHSEFVGSDEMKNDQIRTILSDDIAHFRSKARFYESLNMFEAANYADNLASNIEMALTVMPSDDDIEIA